MDRDDINELSDLEGKTVAHADPSSNSGNLAPRALFAERGVVPGEDYEVKFSGGHENSGIGVFRKDYDAAPVCSTCVQRSIQAGRIEAEDLKVIWASQPFPEGSFGYYHKLHPDLQDGLETAMFDYDYSGTQIPEDFNGRDTFLEIDYNTVWHQNLIIQRANGVDYDIENI
jgi:phosphonate transport system substrate-binding protein